MRIILSLLVLLSAACGLAENEQDERNKLIYLTISDPAFEAYCLAEFDADRNGRLSRYEAQRVRRIDCSGRGIGLLYELSEFPNLETLDCSSNDLTTLDLSDCRYLSRVVCSSNELTSLDLDGLRGLTELVCPHNRFTTLDLRSTASLRVIDCSSNDLASLDIRSCYTRMERVDCRSNPSMTHLWLSPSQSVSSLQTDPQTVVERQ